MSRRPSLPFFSATPVFVRAEYARAIGRQVADRTVSALLTHHIGAGNIRRIARDVYASVPKHADPATWPVDRLLAASRVRPGGVISHHSALELHGYAYSVGHEVQISAGGKPGQFHAPELDCRFVLPRVPLLAEDVVRAERLGLEIAVTGVERTIADLFDRHDLAGGVDELANSLDLIEHLDMRQLVHNLRRLGNAAAAGAVGWWLEANRARLSASPETLEAVRKLVPKQNRYALGAGPSSGRLASGWRVILPKDFIRRPFEGL